jgi:C-terminal processing protease CtpA/Prc
MSLQFMLVVVVLSLISQSSAFNTLKVRSITIPRRDLTMKVENDAFAKANRSQRRAGAGDRMVELKMPLGMDLEEDENGNVYVKSIEKGGRAEKSGMIFVGDIVAMVSATFGDDMWSARGVGLDRVVSSIKVRNSKPVRLVLEAANEQEEKKRRAIAFREATEEEKKALQIKNDDLLEKMMDNDKELGKKRKFLGLF